MLNHLSCDEFLKLAKNANRVAIYREISADRLTPVRIAESLETEMLNGVILESGNHHETTGQYSYIMFDCMAELSAKENQVLVRKANQLSTHTTHPFVKLRKLISDLSFQCNIEGINAAVGFLTYDAIRYFESIPDRHPSDNKLPDMLFNFYRTTLRFDHQQQKLLLSMVVEPGQDPKNTFDETQTKLNELIRNISTFNPEQKTPSVKEKINTDVMSDINDEDFMQLVSRAKAYIEKGDAFQIVLSRQFNVSYSETPFNIYRSLRSINPAPYLFYLNLGHTVIVGASPEKLISVNHREVEMHPIAGTCPRLDDNEDNIARQLLQSKKDCAEHMMLVDLARNDLGRVCEPGSIQVRELMQVKHYTHVSHLTSVVTGKLSDQKDALDALVAAFPAGTLSGAPKIMAMHIIDELETSKRGIYGGVICRIDFQGNLDSCIAIRMAVLEEGIAKVRAGAGIVFDSDPKAEADETRQKAQGILAALAHAERG